jgi:hypothetical protein
MARATPLREVLAAGLKSARTDLGLRQEDAAACIRAQGLTSWIRGTVAQAEVGARRLTFEEVLLLSIAYGTTPAALVAGEDDDLVELTPRAQMPVATLRALLSGQAVAPAARETVSDQPHEGVGEAERHVARRLGTSPEQVGELAQALWGRSLPEERDRRLADQSADLSPRRLQALRGHVTRELMAELTTDGRLRSAPRRAVKTQPTQGVKRGAT